MVGLVGALSSPTLAAETLTVTDSGDSGPGTLREAIASANPGDTITFAPDLNGVNGGTITLTSGELSIYKNLTIEGPGAGKLAVSGNDQSRVLNINTSFPVSISGLTIKEGNGVGGGGGIYSNHGATIKLTNVTIRNNTASTVGGGIYGISDEGVMELTNVTVSNNTAVGTGSDPFSAGGGIWLWGGTLKLTNSIVSNNTAFSRGGGISNEHGDPSPTAGTVILTNSTVSGNTSYGAGGGIANKDGTMVLTDSTVSNNTASETGGGIGNSYKMQLINSTVSNNTASLNGGGIASGGADATTELTNTTVSNNTSPYAGSGIYNAYSTVKLTNSTVSNNTVTNAGFGGGGFVSTNNDPTHDLVHNTIIAGNSGSYGRDVLGAFTSLGHNLIGDGSNSSGFTDGQNGDKVGTEASPIDPKLGPLQDNGGPTQTQALQQGSLAIDKAVAVEGITTDQRGVARPQGEAPDIGAFELEVTADTMAPVTTPSATAGGSTYNFGGWTNKDVTITLTGSDEGGSGVDKIFYNTDGSTTYQEYTAPVSITSEGTTTISYYATDNSGNSEEVKTFTIKIDKSAPTTTPTFSTQPNANGWYNKDVTITLSATDQAALSGVKEITYSATGAQAVSETKVPGSSAKLTITKEGQTTITYFATDQAANTEQPSKTLTIKLDKSAPKVMSVTPLDGTKGVARGVNVTATFSEDMDVNTIKGTTFKLFKKGSSTPLSATVSYNPTTKTATLNPFSSSTTLLARGVTYKAVVSTGTRDMAGNQLDQNPTLAGPQQKAWFFTIKS
jgi:hypothetical protein